MKIWETMERKVENRRISRNLRINEKGYKNLEYFCRSVEDYINNTMGALWFEIIFNEYNEVILEIAKPIIVAPYDKDFLKILMNVQEFSARVEKHSEAESLAPYIITRFTFKHDVFE